MRPKMGERWKLQYIFNAWHTVPVFSQSRRRDLDFFSNPSRATGHYDNALRKIDVAQGGEMAEPAGDLLRLYHHALPRTIISKPRS